jgi:hypothetical protein
MDLFTYGVYMCVYINNGCILTYEYMHANTRLTYLSNQCYNHAQGSTVRGAQPDRDKIFFSINVQTSSGAHPALYPTGTVPLFFFFLPGAKRSGSEFDFLHPSSAPRLCLPRAERDYIMLYVAVYMCAYRVSFLNN